MLPVEDPSSHRHGVVDGGVVDAGAHGELSQAALKQLQRLRHLLVEILRRLVGDAKVKVVGVEPVGGDKGSGVLELFRVIRVTAALVLKKMGKRAEAENWKNFRNFERKLLLLLLLDGRLLYSVDTCLIDD